jgi:hypothetical protein
VEADHQLLELVRHLPAKSDHSLDPQRILRVLSRVEHEDLFAGNAGYVENGRFETGR